MRNVKQELIKTLAGTVRVTCAVIMIDNEDQKKSFILKVNYSNEQFTTFLNSLDFEYDDSHGLQQLYGTVWLEDGTWLTRVEHNSLEWWEHNGIPTIPEDCL